MQVIYNNNLFYKIVKINQILTKMHVVKILRVRKDRKSKTFLQKPDRLSAIFVAC